MNIMGIGPQEMVVIAVIALLIFGPGKLPEVMGQAGKFYRDFRRMSGDLTKEFESTLAEARNLTKEFEAEVSGLSKEVNEISRGVQKDLGIKNSSTAKGKSSSASRSSSTSKPGAKSTTTSRAGGAKASTSTSTAKKTPSSTASSGAASDPGIKVPGVATTNKKAPTPIASREDPDVDVSFFEPAPVVRKKRTRRAVPSVIADPTPRTNVAEPASAGAPPPGSSDDPLARARERRRTAGYAQSTA